MTNATNAFRFLAIGIALIISVRGVSAQGVPPGQLSTLTAEWWQWALSIPASVNPLTDEVGTNCMVGQRGSIWFLSGFFGIGSATRTCSVPEGVTLFFPVINFVDVNAPQCGGAIQTAEELQAESQPAINDIHSVLVEIDGQDVKKTLLQLVVPKPFAVTLPTNNLFGCPAGIYSPAVDGGAYVSVPPLTPGRHSIHFHGESDSDFFGHVVQDVTYELTVVPISLK